MKQKVIQEPAQVELYSGRLAEEIPLVRQHFNRRLAGMHRIYGKGPDGARCGNCVHLRSHGHDNKRFYKCPKSGPITHGPASDWRVRAQACGLYEPRDQ